MFRRSWSSSSDITAPGHSTTTTCTSAKTGTGASRSCRSLETCWSWPAAAATGPPVGRQGPLGNRRRRRPGDVLAFARQRARGLPVEFIQTDVFAWQPPRRYDTVFFAFWLTHVTPGPVRQLLVDGRDGPDTGRAGLLRRRQRPRNRGRTFCARPGETGGLAPAWATAASTGWSRSTTRRVSLRPGWPSWAGRQTSARPAPRCLSGPLEGPATSSLDTMEWAPGWQ
jgi:hypothetical protein